MLIVVSLSTTTDLIKLPNKSLWNMCVSTIQHNPSNSVLPVTPTQALGYDFAGGLLTRNVYELTPRGPSQ